MPAAGRGGVTSKGERVAQSILDAAIETIADVGCSGASLQRIADRAGVDKRVLGYYFGGRDEVLAAVTARVGERLLGEAEAAISEIVHPVEGFALGFAVLWRSVVEHPRLHAAYLALVAASISDPALAPHVAAVRERYDHLVQERAQVAESLGYVWPMGRETMSAMVLALLQGLTLDYLQRGDTPQLRDALAAYQEWMQGLAIRPAT